MRKRLPPRFDDQEYVPDDKEDTPPKPRRQLTKRQLKPTDKKRQLPPKFVDDEVILYDEAPAPAPPKRKQVIKKNEVKKEVARPKRHAPKPKKYLSDGDDDDSTSETLRSPPTTSVRDMVLANGTFIDSGHEAQVYKYKGHAYKIFVSLAYPNRIQRNVDFLKNNKQSGVVPQYINSNVKDGWIQMEYLGKYKPLKNKFVTTCTKQSEDCKLEFLKAICKARNKLPDDIHFTDLTKWDNIAFKITESGKIKIKFYEGGENERVHSGARNDYCYAMAKKMNVVRKAQKINLI